jgi:hypothetical protein
MSTPQAPQKRPPNTLYHGLRLLKDRGVPNGVHVVVRVNSRWQQLAAQAACRLNPAIGFEWGYCGAGPLQLALALVYDATGDSSLAMRAHEWFMRAAVSQWGRKWTISAAQIHTWVEQWERETQPRDLRERMRDPGYTPTVAEALADPDGFAAGMEEIEVHIRTEEGGAT